MSASDCPASSEEWIVVTLVRMSGDSVTGGVNQIRRRKSELAETFRKDVAMLTATPMNRENIVNSDGKLIRGRWPLSSILTEDASTVTVVRRNPPSAREKFKHLERCDGCDSLQYTCHCLQWYGDQYEWIMSLCKACGGEDC